MRHIIVGLWLLAALFVHTALAQPSLSVFNAANSEKASALQIVTTDFPPYSFERYDYAAGLATDIVLSVLERAGISYERPLIQPWARTYQSALHGHNTLIYSIARSPEREHLFHWIGKIAPYSVYLYKLRERQDIRVASLNDAKRYMVGGEFQDIKQTYLQKQGFEEGKNLQLAADDAINLRKLFAGRIDLLPFDEASLPYMLQKEGLSTEALEPVLFLKDLSYDLHLAMSIQSDAQLVTALRDALHGLHKDGTVAGIQDRYLGARLAGGAAP